MESKKHIHFIGIGGIGISGLARFYVHEGWQVSGSDIEDKPLLSDLEIQGITVARTQTVENITADIDCFVYSAAVNDDNSELVAARATGKPILNYFEAVAQVANEYYLIAVAGAHGKTTTTAMLIDILEEASFDPSAIVGSLRTKTGSNYRAGKSKYFIVEACEYRRHFLHFNPDVLVITNIEYEHVDYYKGLADVQAAFKELVQKVPADGFVIAATKDINVAPVIEDASARVFDYQEVLDLELDLAQPGMHNQLNAAAARGAALALGIEKKYIDEALRGFVGTKRRFEFKGEVHNAPVYDDYAHHPTEIKAAIAGAREKYPDRKLTVVFQPHTYSRTKELLPDFVTALGKADRVILVPIYAAREKDDGTVSSEMVVDALIKIGVAAEHFFTLDAAAKAVSDSVGSSDVILVMGAGDVTNVSAALVK